MTAAPAGTVDTDGATAHLTPERWQRATRHLIRKALAEFSHERLLTPVPLGPAPSTPGGPRGYRVTSDDGRTAYRFTAELLALDHWHIDPASITRRAAGEAAEEAGDAPAGGESELPLDALAFFTDLRATLGLGHRVLPLYLEEITATLSSLAFKDVVHRRTAADLLAAGFQAVESGMTEGHPCFVANSGRIGFGARDLVRYAPEAGAPVRLTWVAARRDLADFSAGAGLDYATLIAAELDRATRARFAAVLSARGLDPDGYLLIPVHPWQWEHRLAVTFAGEVAREHLVLLGPGDDDHLAQQSVRTFFNVSRPDRHYVKTALSVLNMGFLRGLSAAYMAATPAINDWLAALIAADPTLTAARFSIIRERAAVGYRHRPFEEATQKGSPYRKMLAALWRESPIAGLEPGRSLVTMASLLHVDAAGGSLAAVLVARSGRSPEAWLRGYLDAYLVPVLHSLFAYDLAYMPHGENVILVLGEDGGSVERAVFKDIAEEIVVMDPAAALPPEVARIRAEVPEELRALSVFTDVFDCFLRFLGATLHTAGVLDEAAFWRTVADCVTGYQEAHPALAEKFARYDLFAPRFALSCLNRLQLRDNQQMVDLADPSAALQFAGTLANPLAAHRPPARKEAPVSRSA
ncbi:IucA/IucC family protein [Actinacidiphila acidipaludis]|uniref:IucA/IucC family siderophore biosynthesis protein n=1 Tax=Actinacidiphila acidipaludis TaxID=2873382 RepID=A0ABS7QCC6_9ACTN|nr:IucA/IucC family siderophore biosynthesis protein [Streptomyces acidipaludis]MBY8880809.1 IucA/IucC family siderophore biosynthesis protein [Streptomyces acidipaludis]